MLLHRPTALADNSVALTLELSLDGRITEMSSSLATLLNRPVQALKGHLVFDFLAAESRRLFERVLKTGKPVQLTREADEGIQSIAAVAKQAA